MPDDEDKVLEEESKNWDFPITEPVATNPTTPTAKEDKPDDFSFHPFAKDKIDDTAQDEVTSPSIPKSPFDDDDEEIEPTVPAMDSKTDTDDSQFVVDDITKPDPAPEDKDDKPIATPDPESSSTSNADLSGLKGDFDKAAADIKSGIDKMSSILSDLIAKSQSLESSNKSLEAEKTKLQDSLKKVKDTISNL